MYTKKPHHLWPSSPSLGVSLYTFPTVAFIFTSPFIALIHLTLRTLEDSTDLRALLECLRIMAYAHHILQKESLCLQLMPILACKENAL